MTVGIVVVSHSRPLADAAVALATEMVRGDAGFIVSASGVDDGGFGTDAVAIGEAITRVDTGDGVVVLMDLGSAVLSAETALEFVDDATRERTLLCPAPLVEGLVAAAVAAGSGAPAAEVAAEAGGALDGKLSHLDAPAGAEAPAAVESAQPGPDAAAAGPVPPVPAGTSADGVHTGRFTVSLPHGLHARPAAVVVQAVRGLDARVSLRNATLDTAPVDAAGLSRVATLGALKGHEVEVSATGPDAGAAVDALLTLARDGFGESAPAPPTVSDVPAGRPVPAAPGIGIGPARPRTAAEVVPPGPRPGPPGDHWKRVERARERVRGDLTRVRDRAAREIGAAEAGIFDAQLAMLDDPELVEAIRSDVDRGTDAARAWIDAIGAVERQFAAVEDEYLAARVADVRDLRDRVLRALGGTVSAGPAADGVLVADDLTLTEATELDPARTAAVLLAHGSPTAHSVILLRARGIPAVVGAASLVERAREGTTVVLDGSTGEVVLDPDPPTLADFRDRARALARRRADALSHADEPAVTTDGTTVLVGANLGSTQDARDATGADLAGLVRTEFCFLGRREAPTVDEQEADYRAIAEAMAGRCVTLRTLDVGGDKPLGYLPQSAEANPFLGVRGLRLALARPELLADQLEAIVRVAHDHPADVMFPMVATLDELTAARGMLRQAVARVGRGEPDLRVGIMVEVPAAALKAPVFAPHVDFLSIGTNDLTQYALAAERGNEALAALADPLDPGVLALIAAAGAVAGPDLLVAVCGEMAADEAAVPLLLGLGVRELSVAPAAVAGVKKAVRGVDVATARDLAARALAAPDAAAVRALLGQNGAGGRA
ncbi:phosphoenolpyruvate--protein phosphotransferase [Pseudonocardia nematodicida]|uniref:Phosphocarrier protein HPr n=1 Tax=Pseudonocardia nematodicida TaxID=1206997 RepID=A0ABV1KFJ4_9PSEU